MRQVKIRAVVEATITKKLFQSQKRIFRYNISSLKGRAIISFFWLLAIGVGIFIKPLYTIVIRTVETIYPVLLNKNMAHHGSDTRPTKLDIFDSLDSLVRSGACDPQRICDHTKEYIAVERKKAQSSISGAEKPVVLRSSRKCTWKFHNAPWRNDIEVRTRG